jgi:carbonic anhydrase
MPKTALEHLEALLEGNARFAASSATIDRAELAMRQEPYAVVLGCSDSRVPVETIFDRGPGEIFVVRVAGNVVETATLASVEYAVDVLKTPLVLVLGHTGCGAVAAAIDRVRSGTRFPGAIDDLIAPIVPIAEQTRGDEAGWPTRAVEANVRHTAQQLAARSAVLSQAIAGRRIALIGALYDLRDGRVRIVS